MRVLVVGGSGSGKSAYAERLACRLSPTRTYVATMAGNGPEARARIRRHRMQRAGLAFTTLECTDSLPLDQLTPHAASGVVLLEDVGNLVANALFSADGRLRDRATTCDRLMRDILALSDAFVHAVVVGNEVGSEGQSPYEGTRSWVRLMGTLCKAVAREFDVVVEVTAGIPQVIKGELP